MACPTMADNGEFGANGQTGALLHR